jgi:putative endonuclease
MGSGELGGASIYILLCSDGSDYTGITRRSVEERVSEHAQGLTPGYTFTRRPVKLVFSEQYERIIDAIAARLLPPLWRRAGKGFNDEVRGGFCSLCRSQRAALWRLRPRTAYLAARDKAIAT